MKSKSKLRDWIFPAAVVLFVVQVILLPIVVGVTYPSRNVRPEHTLSYTSRSLTWDRDTSVRSDGSAELSFFETIYQNVSADNAEKVLAPGTEKDSVVRLKNDTKRRIGFTAVLYSLSTTPDLDISAAMSGDGLTDTDRYTLPDGIADGAVIRAVNGSVIADGMQDFDIDWSWAFTDEANEAGRDEIDTYLGNKSADGDADEATVGLYIVVHDDGDVVPKTGDNSMIYGYLVLMAMSGALCAVLTVERIRSGKNAR